MGHYVPQRYLRNFECSDRPSFVWQYDRQTGEPRPVAIKQAAQSPNYYAAEHESLLAAGVEGPANPVIEKIIQRTPITSNERRALALYAATMLMRVPANREKLFTTYPNRLKDYCNDVRQQLHEHAKTLPDVTPEMLARGLAQMDDFEKRWAENPSPEVLDQMLTPMPFRNMVEVINAMTWCVMVSSGPDYFITSDNPAFMFDSYGLGRQESELSLPLSPTIALHGSWQQAEEGLLVYTNAPQKFVREVNGRLASSAVRFAYAHRRTPWLPGVLAKTKPFLSALRWSKAPRWRQPPPLDPDGHQRYL